MIPKHATDRWLRELCEDRAEHLAVLELLRFARYLVSPGGFTLRDGWQPTTEIITPVELGKRIHCN